MIPAIAVLLSDRADEVLGRLEASSDRKAQVVARRARALRPVLLVDCLHGEVVKKGAIPPHLRAAYGLENLYAEDLPGFWRLLYTVVKADGKRTIVVVELVDHKQYSKWFPGRHR